MAFSYPKIEKLKSKKSIDLLFLKGKSVSKYPLRLVYVQHDFEEDISLKLGVSVSKKYFKSAVDRNYYKRVLRECYRLNKQLLIQNLTAKYCFMFFYQTSEKLLYPEIDEKTIQLFEKFNNAILEERTESKQ
ncbi:ribonuclease P protein component [Flavobacterium sp.]|uniref:ribonuclease P protein component n=1 Tax=Flavobacterium sp. TaxID=239 RepID=UPI0025D15284|nr:ribonuclease P protein component [Flavobacterium sp.]